MEDRRECGQRASTVMPMLRVVKASLAAVKTASAVAPRRRGALEAVLVGDKAG